MTYRSGFGKFADRGGDLRDLLVERKGPTSMTDGRKRAFGVEGADVGLGLRPKNIGAGFR